MPDPTGGEGSGQNSQGGGGQITTTNAATTAVGTVEWFAAQVLEGLGAPITADNVNFILSWITREGGGGRFNPLNTTFSEPGATDLSGNPDGVKNYTSPEQGVQATVATLQAGYYTDIVSAFKAGNINQAATYAGLSSWSGGGYDTLAGVSAASGSMQDTTYGSSTGTGGGNLTNSNDTGDSLGATTQQVEAQLQQEYGYAAAFWQDAGLQYLINEAVQDQWTDAQFEAALMDSQWYKTNTASQRQWLQLQTSDPRQAAYQLAQAANSIRVMARQMGVAIDPARLNEMALNSEEFGWYNNNALMQQYIGAEFHYNPNDTYTGTAGTDIMDYQKMSDAYLVPLSAQTINTWTRQALEGKIAPTDYTSYLADQAKSMFPYMTKAIDSGQTPQQYAQAYADTASKLLGVNSASIDFTEPKWQAALTQIDPKTGDKLPMSLSQWQTKLMTDPLYGFNTTQNARDMAAGLAASISQEFGYNPDTASGQNPMEGNIIPSTS